MRTVESVGRKGGKHVQLSTPKRSIERKNNSLIPAE